MEPLLTHVIVAYNHAAYIEQAILSALDQTVPTRLVIIDDASTDGTAAVVRRVLDREGADAVFVAQVQNKGLTASLNEGLRNVTTEYFAYFAGDDWVEPNRAELQTAVMERAGDSCVLSYSDCYRATETGHRFGLLFSERHPATWRSIDGDIFEELLLGANWLPAPSLMQRTSAVVALGGYDEDLAYEDYDICLRLARAGSVAFVDTPLATHREHAASLGSALFQRGNSRWMRDLVNIDRKHLGARASADQALAVRIRERLVQLYESGESANWVDQRLRETAEILKGTESVSQRLERVVIRLRVPGRTIHAAKAKLRGGPPARARAAAGEDGRRG